MQNKITSFVLFVFVMCSSQAQQISLKEALWNQVDGKPTDVQHYGNETKIIDDSNNGFLQIETIEEGCGCYFKTQVGAYKKTDNSYTFLKTEEDGCNWRRNLSATPRLHPVLPKNFELPEFLSESAKKKYTNTNTFPIFYIDVNIPRKGTDTKVDLAYIPFGVRLSNRNDVLALTGYSELNNEGKSDYTYSGELQRLISSLKNEETLHAIIAGKFDTNNSVDGELVQTILGEDKPYASLENLAEDLKDLQTIYEFSKQIAFKSIILGWNAEKARFFVKEKIKNDAPELSFLEFIQQLPFLKAVC